MACQTGGGVRELADRAGVTANTVTRIENGADAKQSTMDALQRALETAGLEFLNGEQPGVRLRKGTGEPLADAPKASHQEPPSLPLMPGRSIWRTAPS